jgi:hypothetical protein
MKKINVPFNGKGRSVSYKIEMIDLSMTPVGFLNVYSVFVDDDELQKIVGDHFTILHNSTQTIKPCFESSDNTYVFNLKKTIAQQIMNNHTE